mgnify:CR=1 FL=1
MSAELRWMNDLPNGWGVRRLAYLGEFLKGRGIARENITDDGVPAILYGDIYTQYDVKTDRLVKFTTAEVAEGSEPIQYGDLLLTGSGETKEDIGKCVAYLGKERAYAGGDVIILRQDQVDSLFLSYVLNSAPSVAQKTQMGKGEIIVHIYSSDLRNLVFALPPLTTQRRIASYLNEETARIDALVKAKQEMLALLEKKRAALVSQAVTKGLDLKVQMKDSGIEWLGEIPEHWEVRRFKFLTTERLMYGANEAAEEIEPTWPRYVRITDVTEQGTLRDETFRSLAPEIAAPYLLQEGDILFARSGATVGKSFRYQQQWGVACFAGYLIRMRCDLEQVSPEYVELFTTTPAYWAQVGAGTIQATIPNFSAEKYGDVVMPLPSLKEQRAIVKRVAHEGEPLKRMEAAITESIGFLARRRAALITAAVTGRMNIN